MMKKIGLLTLLLMISSLAYTQTGKSVVMNAGNDSSTLHIKVKWYSESIYYNKGVNIYRSEVGSKSWVKLNDDPIKKGRQVTFQQLKNEQDLNVLAGITNKKRGGELEGLVKLSVLVQSIFHERFALYLGLQFNDSTVELGKRYQYRIMKVRADKKETLISTAGPIAVQYQTKAAPPTEIVLSAKEREITFNWKIEEDRFFAVNIYRSTTGEEKEKLNSRPVIVSSYEGEDGKLTFPEHFFIDDSLRSGENYYYQLTSIDYFGYESAPSEEFHITIIDKTPPPAPRLKHTQKNKVRALEWKQKKVDDLAGNNIYRSRIGDTTYLMVNDTLIGPEVDSWKINNNYPGSYWYYVEAKDTSGNRARSEQVLVNIPDEVPPDMPAGVNVDIEPGKVRIIWSENKEPDLLGYQVFRALNRGKDPLFYPMFVQPQEAASYEQGIPLISKETYLYKVAAVDTFYNRSAFSLPVKVQFPDVVPPETPIIKDAYVSDDFIHVEWLSSDRDVHQYTIFRSEGDNEFTRVSAVMSDINVFLDKNVKSGTLYNYQISATDSAGNTSQPSVNISVRLHKTATSVITAFNAKYRKRQKEIALEWEVKNPQNLKGYIIYQALDSGGFKPVTGLLKDMSLDIQLQSGHYYQYQVRAFDHYGNVFKSEVFEITIKE